MIRQLAASHSAVLVVDMQASLMPVIDQAQDRTDAALRLLRAAKRFDIPVLATEHLAGKLGRTVEPLLTCFDGVLDKSHFDGTREAAFRTFLPAGRHQIIVCGAEAHVCVMQTALGLLRAGLDVWVATDACGSRHDADRQLAFDRLQRAGAEIVNTEIVLFEWLDCASHPAFRDVLSLIKSRDQG